MINTGSEDAEGGKATLYGLDIELLKSLNLDELIEDKKKDEELKRLDEEEGEDIMNMTMDQMRKKFNKEENSNAVNKLRNRCSYYK